MIALHNCWHGIGRFTSDIELNQTASGISVCNFSLAVDRPGASKDSKITDFFDFVAWRQTAEMIAKYFKKGDPIGIMGCLATDTWEKDGKKNKKVVIQVDSIDFLPARKQTGGQDSAEPVPESSAPVPEPVAVETDELPF